MLFDKVVESHVNRLYNLKERFLKNLISEEAYSVAQGIEYNAWRDICSMLEDRGFVERPLVDLSSEELSEYDNLDNYPLVSVLKYRGVMVPIYDDDYGQQVFAKYGDIEISGGAYNLDYCDTFVDMLDYYLDQKAIEALESK